MTATVPLLAPGGKFWTPADMIAAGERCCPACPARPGEQCDGSVVPCYEGVHFARVRPPW